MAKTSREYWTEREEQHRKSLVRDEKKLASEINDTYARMIREANNQIAEWYQKYATKEGITLAEAKRRVSSLDIKEYSEKAKQYVKDRDMSEQANQEMRLYNLTMKVNRLELLKSEIGMHMAGGFNDIEKIIGVGLTEEARAEMRRQAGILGHTVLHNERAAEVIANSSFKNATFSDRIWQHQDMLKTELDRSLQRGLIQGKSSKALAIDIRKIFGASQKNAERLMITEMARAQIEAQKASYERNGYEEYMYIACGASDCCDECASLDGQVFPVKDMQPGVNAPPMHPYCHCSTAAYVDEEKYRRMLDEAAEENRRAREEAEEQVERGGLSAAGNNDTVEPHDPPVFIRKVLVNEDRQRILSEYEKQIVDSPIENAIVITKDGNLYHCKGTLNGVYPDYDLGEELRGADVTHNHPKGSANEWSFSDADRSLFINYDLHVLRGIDELFEYEYNRNKEDLDEISESIFDIDQYSARHEQVRDEARRYGIGYRRKKHG